MSMPRLLAGGLTRLALAFALCLGLVGPLCACSQSQDASDSDATESQDVPESQHEVPQVSSELTYESSMQIDYATGFAVDYFEGGYKLITVTDEGMFLVVPEGMSAPQDLSDDVTVLQQPFQNIYLVATSVMDMFVSLGSLDAVRLSGLEQSGWYVEQAADAMEAGEIVYAGKYNMPDYELIYSEGCDLAIESMMIYHNPEVQENIEGYGIPVFVDQSSNESDPLGRVEWVKVYGALLGKDEEAASAFQEQEAMFTEVIESTGEADSGKTVSYFYVTNAGSVSTRRTDDYIPKIIQYAGGHYLPDEEYGDPGSKNGTITMQMEEFYAEVSGVDVIVYNAAIDAQLSEIDELVGKSSFLADFKAVQEGHVWCTTKSLYQDSMHMGEFVTDLYKILQDPDVADEELTYLYRLV